MLEIKDILEAYDRQETRKKKERVANLFVLAEVIANRVAISFNGKADPEDYMQPWHFYPGLFEDKSEEIEEQRELKETEKLKILMDSRVAAWNKRFEEEHKDGSGKTDDKSNGGDVGRTSETQEAS